MLGAMAVGGGDLTVVVLSYVLRLVESVTMGSAAKAEEAAIAAKTISFLSILVPFDFIIR
jgi:hypothetical protein